MATRLKFKYMVPRLIQGTIVCVFLFVGFSAKSQDCSAKLDLAKENYRIGKLYDIPGIMDGCLDMSELSRQQLVEAYELLSITYLYIDEPELAEESYLKLLAADPEYRPDSIIEVEIEFLSKRFKTTPIFTLYPAKLGTNVTIPRVINVNGTDNTSNSNQSYKSQWGVQLGGGADWNISQKFSLGAEVWFDFTQFRFTNQFFDTDSLQLNEQHLSVEVPVFFRYTHRINKWYPYVLGGYSISYLINASVTPNYFEITEVLDNQGNVEERIINPDLGRSLNLTKIRNQLNHNLVLGFGVNYRLEYQYISFEVRYTAGLKNILDTKDQFDFGKLEGNNVDNRNEDLREYTFRYGQVDNDFRLDNLSITFGYVYPLYKPRKIQRKSVKGIFGNLFKSKEKVTY